MPGMPGLQWQQQLDGQQGAGEVPRALASGCWPQGVEAKGSINGTLCGQGQRSTWPKPGVSCQTHLPLSFLGLPCLPAAPALPPSKERACLDSASLCPALTSFQMNQPQELDDFFPGPGPAPLPALLRVAFQHPLPGLPELTPAWAVIDQGMCWRLLEATGLVLGSKGNRLGKQRLGGSGVSLKLRPQGEACISWAGSPCLPPCSPACGQPRATPGCPLALGCGL